MSPFTRTDARRIRRELEKIVENGIKKGDCDHNCRVCALLSSIRAGKGTQCTLNILELCLTGELE